MNHKFHKLSFIIAAMFLLLAGNNDWLAAQETDQPENDGPEVEQQSQEEIDQALENILKKLPQMEDDSDENPKEKNKSRQTNEPPTVNDKEDQKNSDEEDKDDGDPGIVVELQKQLDALKAKNQESTKKDLTSMKRLSSQLKTAKSIEQQFKKMPIKKTSRKESDSFVVANLEVKPNGDELEVSFQSTQGEKGSVRLMFEFVTGTPSDGYRDFRIISRHNDSNVELALNGVRLEYDKAKEREKQFLEYIQQQQARMARIKASRRC